jgi:hypothetical protein
LKIHSFSQFFLKLFSFIYRRSSSSGDSITKMLSCGGTGGSVMKPMLQKRNSGPWVIKGTSSQKYLWIRLALFERILAGMIENIVGNHL